LPANRYDPDMKAVFYRLKEKGKAGKVALVAVMRRMIIVSNARMRDHRATVLDRKHRCFLQYGVIKTWYQGRCGWRWQARQQIFDSDNDASF
jgi:transposase